MTLDVLRGLAGALTSDAAASAIVDYIAADGGHGLGDRDFVDVYADAQVRNAVFGGTACTGTGLVMLSTAAQLLKAALQRRGVQTTDNQGNSQFRGTLCWHITNNIRIARLILAGGFRPGSGTTGGYGVYFFNDRETCERYVPEGGWGRNNPAVLECVVYSRISRQNHADVAAGYGGDRWANNFLGRIVAVKNPLLIFPRAVFMA